MKFAVCLAASMVAVTSAVTCDYAVVGPTLQTLGKPIASCMTATGNSYNLARAPAPPTAEQAEAICSKCPEFVAAVAALPPWPDCTMNVGGSEQTLTSYFDKMVGGCKAAGSSAATTTTTTTNATATEAPAATTAAPAKETATASSDGSKGDAMESANNSTGTASGDVTTAPAKTTAPVPAPTTSAGYSVGVGIAAASAVATTMVLVF